MYKKKSISILKAILRSLKKGSSVNAACNAAGVDVSSFWAWRKKDKELDARVKEIYDSRITIVEDALYKAALEGNITAQIFFLKNRQPNRWRDVHKIEGDGFGNTNIHIHPNKVLVFKDIEENAADNRRTDNLYVPEGTNGGCEAI